MMFPTPMNEWWLRVIVNSFAPRKSRVTAIVYDTNPSTDKTNPLTKLTKQRCGFNKSIPTTCDILHGLRSGLFGNPVRVRFGL